MEMITLVCEIIIHIDWYSHVNNVLSVETFTSMQDWLLVLFTLLWQKSVTAVWLNMDFLFISEGTIVMFVDNDAKKGVSTCAIACVRSSTNILSMKWFFPVEHVHSWIAIKCAGWLKLLVMFWLFTFIPWKILITVFFFCWDIWRIEWSICFSL